MPIFDFNADKGSVYAQTYALYDNLPQEQKLFYHDPEADCTNFISQCVWAAYGGWITGFSPEKVSQNEQRILNDIRQVKNIWYGSKSFVGSNNWCRAVEFFDFATQNNKAFGPQADKIDEGIWSEVDPRIIIKGDVVQMVVTSYAPNRYGHGLYVTKQGETWEDILICCHSDDRLNEPLSSFSQDPKTYAKIRILRFLPSNFKS